ncbi:MAG: PilT/PilU family type 4a pilus ATPase [Deltaproteobacteria bacterium]|nr:PilT/PilU family type 4a pilus ATPase [Deltaproteobacteria bacterium]MBI3387011.1 PilT/PilU family type 4a pilus ATPase [Deltaproteobacteria bacterium]
MPAIDQWFDAMLAADGSDLHLAEGQPPKIRRNGRLEQLDYPALTADTMHAYLKEICSAERWQQFLDSGDLDFAYAFGEKARFRSNYFNQSHGMGAVFRTIPSKIKTLDDLKLPAVLKTFSLLRSGLVLVTGPTGSGKSTTLAAIIDLINETSARHILTIEEPIEFVHPNKMSILCQREVGIDVSSFADGLRTAGRQDCDVILVGEMRDYETISMAVSAASTGSLVFGTLHTSSAVKTVDRIIDAFPSGQQAQIRSMLADSLKGVCAQILLRTADGNGRLACNEILLSSGALANSIREGKTPNIRNIIQGGKSQGMQLMDDAIQKYLSEQKITGEEAYMKATEKSRFIQHAQRA